ncbi:Type cbb3 cytochrome oxidase biogenesis protein CcoI; Copper-translocating P-type ATPase [Candidatus Phaeomarinobacter ectocarpi]|uniref:Type cbb3 cytochrome oxidase biogenesis protein CcoI Copper-translocating P-type ATPase n=1 Tax=Candidatus Phaeomarinibacter ectocarpi TaxID=1458461 RepID=X5MKZ1_9HYPH|nr:heavy metal translocating P-type ATPase [Candidatus Phaeomarinobacter ectocarpi]CDO59015.1 Type cbb3 cytochrome oxidase biogenesis protein CcoI; Copper-translocating P-type ATPase [Candidatus Phaeomarinobacter ectocarpi]
MADASISSGADIGQDIPDIPDTYVRALDDGSSVVNFVVDGVHCGGCVKRVERAVNGLEGVANGRLNLSTKRLTVVFEQAMVRPREIVSAIVGAGYGARPYDPKTLETQQARDEKELITCVGVAGFAAANVMLLSVSVWAGHSGGMEAATRDMFHWISGLIAMPAIAYAGRPFFRSAVSALRVGAMNMDVPISLAVLLAAGMSLAETIAGAKHVYFDASIMLLFFLLIGRTLDMKMRGRAALAAQNLLALRADAATVIDDDGVARAMPVEALKPGMVVAVATGQRIAADGVVEEGRSDLDTSLITGETAPVAVAPGADVFAGTLNMSGPLRVRVTKGDEATLLSEIVRLMEAAEQGRDTFVRIADRAARVYAPAVHILAAATFIGWMLLGGLAWDGSLKIAIAVLIITCPCALGLAVPVVHVVASGRLLSRGVLLKSSDALERLAEVDTLVFDKTGTLTHGRLALDDADVDRTALERAATLARASTHPLSRALAQAAGVGPQGDDVSEHPGQGLMGTVDGQAARLGSAAFVGGIDATENDATGPEIWFRCGDAAPVRFGFLDGLREDASAVIEWAADRGMKIVLLSGDRPATVEAVAREAGVSNFAGGLLPQDKIARLEELAGQGAKVLMVGDGLNDAPALAAAHVSMSPASGADVSQAAADLVFQGQELAPVTVALDVARGSQRLVLENFGLSLAYNVVAVPIAVAGYVTPLIAAIAMSSSSILVTANAIRLRWGKMGLPETVKEDAH